jgi:hypothetical protein
LLPQNRTGQLCFLRLLLPSSLFFCSALPFAFILFFFFFIVHSLVALSRG